MNAASLTPPTIGLTSARRGAGRPRPSPAGYKRFRSGVFCAHYGVCGRVSSVPWTGPSWDPPTSLGRKRSLSSETMNTDVMSPLGRAGYR